MTALGCTLLSAIGFYFSFGLGDQWWLSWLAPIPILWFAFGNARSWRVFAASGFAMALGASSILRAYGESLPALVLALSIGAPSLAFAGAVMGARRVKYALGPVAAMFAFATLRTAFDFLASFSNSGGSVGTPAAAEVSMPMLIQVASLVGFPGITFLLSIVPAGISASMRTRSPLPAAIALALFSANAIYGHWRMSLPPSGTMRVALVESDDAVGRFRADDREATLKAIDAYVATVEKLNDKGVQLIVLPENISRVAPEWRDEVQARLAAASNRSNSTLVAGFNTTIDNVQRNISWSFTPGETTPTTYEKRRLVPVLESAVFTPGSGPKVLANGIGLEICKDMDFQAMLRNDVVQTKPILLAVPAWDFGEDDWSHARVAILRSVENGVPMARSARNGLLTLNDRYGRLVVRAKTTGSFTVLTGDLPINGRGGNTVYDAIGDAFGWFCVVLSLVAMAWSLMRTRQPLAQTKPMVAS
jgi:apolipoprotein N-acyltransferase